MMGSLYIGTTGMKSHSEGMGTIANNLANVNTLGYKQMSIQYADLMSQYLTASSGNMTNINQAGMGSAVGATRTLFTQGSLETSTNALDLSIDGIGFFGVTQNGMTHYTRAGNFRFNADGELLDPSGWNVLGRPIVNGSVSGAAVPIQLDMSANGIGSMASQMTTKISTGPRLGGLEDKTADPDNPFFALAASWNGTMSPPLGSDAYGYSEPISFYDSTGALRKATIYYDLAGSNNGLTAVEYVVAFNPPGDDASGLAGTHAQGLLMAGTLTYASNGELANITAFSPPASGDPSNLGGWTPATLQNGQPVLQIQASGAAAQSVVLDFGISLTGDNASAGGGLASAAAAASNPSAVYNNTVPKSLSAKSSTAVGSTPGSMYIERDGYATGYMKDMYVNADGTVQVSYTNGQTQDVYQITLYRFTSQDGLRHEGGNHYSATPESGPATEGVAGEENFGAIKDYSLEQSNVDYATEFSQLMITQRGFQMNSKVITTSDALLQKALELKR